MHLHTGTHVVSQLFGMPINLDTIYTTWLSAIIVFLIVFAATRSRALIPSGIQNAVELNGFSVSLSRMLEVATVRCLPYY